MGERLFCDPCTVLVGQTEHRAKKFIGAPDGELVFYMPFYNLSGFNGHGCRRFIGVDQSTHTQLGSSEIPHDDAQALGQFFGFEGAEYGWSGAVSGFSII